MFIRSSVSLIRNCKKSEILERNLRLFSSSLLVPLPAKNELPAEFSSGFPLTEAYFKDLYTEHAKFNERCQ